MVNEILVNNYESKYNFNADTSKCIKGSPGFVLVELTSLDKAPHEGPVCCTYILLIKI